MEIDPLPPISVMKAPTPETEGVAHVITDAPLAPGGGCEIDLGGCHRPKVRFVINRIFQHAIGND